MLSQRPLESRFSGVDKFDTTPIKWHLDLQKKTCYEITSLKRKMQGKKAMLLWMFSDIHLLPLNAHKSWLVFVENPWNCLAQPTDCEGPDASSTPGRNVWSHFDWTFICIYIGRKNPIPIASTILLQNPLSKKELDFINQFSTLKNTKILGPFLLNLFDQQVTTMDLCNLGTDVASTLAVKVNRRYWFIRDEGYPAWLVREERRLVGIA